MLPSPLPQWIRDRVPEVIAAYARTAKLNDARCEHLAISGRRNEAGLYCDDLGSIDDYRFDAKYCAGMAVRLPKLLDGSLTYREEAAILRELMALDNGDNQHSKEIPRDPRLLAQRAWDNPWKDAVALPPPKEGIRTARTDERMQELGLTQREAEAWILVRGYEYKAEEAARFMEITPGVVETLVKRARRRMRDADNLENVP